MQKTQIPWLFPFKTLWVSLQILICFEPNPDRIENSINIPFR